MRALWALAILMLSLAPAFAAEVERSILVDGKQRSYLLITPKETKRGMPLVIVYHGGTTSAERARNYTRFDELPEKEDVAVVFPQGVDNNWNDGRITNDIRQRAAADYDDVGFTLAIVDRLAGEGLVDDRRVFLTGASNGGMMSLRAGCERPERFAGIAVVIANQPADWRCSAQGLPALFINGTADKFMPYGGGRIAEGISRKDLGTVLSVDETIAEFRKLNGCGPAIVKDAIDPVGRDRSRAIPVDFQCARAPLKQFIIEGGGHTWPGARTGVIGELVLGETNDDISATDEIWKFFKELAAR